MEFCRRCFVLGPEPWQSLGIGLTLSLSFFTKEFHTYCTGVFREEAVCTTTGVEMKGS